MKKVLSLVALAVCSVFVLNSCVEVNMSSMGKKIKPSSNIITVQHQQKAFEEIDLSVVASVEFVQSEESKVVLTAPDNYIELFKFENRDNELDVSFTRRNINIEGKNVHITIYSPRLTRFENSGVSNVHIKKLNTESLKIDNSGVGNMRIEGLQAQSERSPSQRNRQNLSIIIINNKSIVFLSDIIKPAEGCLLSFRNFLLRIVQRIKKKTRKK